jgi:flagellar L-ring protein precursor FlgH
MSNIWFGGVHYRKYWRLFCVFVLVFFAIGARFSGAQSLYSEDKFRPLTADQRARRVGDVLTVQIIENSTATANADTGAARKNVVAADFGVNHLQGHGLGVKANVGGDFDGGGRTERTGRLAAQLTVVVKEVLPNGDLMVSGEQQLNINDERQKISLVGRVRSQDISELNIVLSTRVADAQITYSGEGYLADRQKPALWRQLVDWLGF